MNATSLLAALALALPASAANIYVLSSGDVPTDNAVLAALTSRGHTCTLGVQYRNFDGTLDLSGFQTVYVQDNYNWGAGYMPAAGQQALLAWVNAGGRLVTCEWTTYYSSPNYPFGLLNPILPLAPSGSYGGQPSTTYTLATPNPTINNGIPNSITFSLTSYSGTEVYATGKPGAIVYYSTSGHAGSPGLAGWAQGNGDVFSFSTTCGPAQLADVDFGNLFSNVMGATVAFACYANCDASTGQPVLDVLDFSCFLNRYATGNAYANCDGSTTEPILNVLDFACYMNKFAAGCQ